jgi:hypothetical protein
VAKSRIQPDAISKSAQFSGLRVEDDEDLEQRAKAHRLCAGQQRSALKLYASTPLMHRRNARRTSALVKYKNY